MFRPIALACASAIALTFAAPAVAQDDRQRRVVEYGDLDLYSGRGADAALRRLETASEDVCDAEPNTMPLGDSNYVETCADETVDYAVSDIGHPGLTARHYGVEPQVIIEEDGDVYHGDKGK